MPRCCAVYQDCLLISYASATVAALRRRLAKRILRRCSFQPRPLGPNASKGARKDLISSQAARTSSRKEPALALDLARCEGFRVESTNGYVGVVESLRYSPSTRWDHPSELVVYAGRGNDLLLIIPAAEAESVSFADRRVVVRPSPKVVRTERVSPASRAGH